LRNATNGLANSIRDSLSSSQKKFLAEVIGTFIVVVLATGSVVIDAKMGGAWGIPFIAFAPFVGVAIGIYLFGKVSMAHFNPAVTLGFLITRHITKRHVLLLYFPAELSGALLASLFVKYAIGDEAFLGGQLPKLCLSVAFDIWGRDIGFCHADGCDFGCCIHKGLEGFWWISNRCYGWIGHILFGVYIWSVNEPRQVLGPCLVIWGMLANLWLYWTATFIGTSIIAILFRKKFSK
jgi:aquaporin Z